MSIMGTFGRPLPKLFRAVVQAARRGCFMAIGVPRITFPPLLARGLFFAASLSCFRAIEVRRIRAPLSQRHARGPHPHADKVAPHGENTKARGKGRVEICERASEASLAAGDESGFMRETRSPPQCAPRDDK
jgi:hypothetical protein